MFSWLSSLSSLSAFTGRVAMILALFCGALVLAPTGVLRYLSIDAFVYGWKAEISLIFIFSICVLVAEIILALRKEVHSRVEVWKLKRHFLYQFRHLSDDEKEFLSDFMDDDISTVTPALGSGVAGSLAAKSIIFRSSQICLFGQGFPYSIQPAALSLLKKYPHFLSERM